MKSFLLMLIICSSIIQSQNFNIKYYSVLSTQNISKVEFNKREINYSIFDKRDNLTYQIKKIMDYDIPNPYLNIFSDGSSVLINTFNTGLEFYDNNGNQTNSISQMIKAPVEYERNIHSYTDNDLLVISIEDRKNNETKFIIYSQEGERLKEFSLNVVNINTISFSKRFSKIFLSINKWSNDGNVMNIIMSIDEEGNAISNFEGNFTKGSFSNNGNFYCFSNHSFMIINCFSNKVLKKSVVHENKIFVYLIENNNELSLIEADKPKLKNTEWICQNPIIYSMKFDGEIIMEKSYTKSFDYNSTKSVHKLLTVIK